MLLGILQAMAAFERETGGQKLTGIILTKWQFDCLLADLSGRAGFELGDEPYSGITLWGVRIEWSNETN